MGKQQPEKREVDFSKLNLARLGHNFLVERKEGNYTVDDLNVLNEYVQYLFEPRNQGLPKYKVGLLFVCINPPYWQYAKPVIDGVKAYFLPDHDVEVMLWSDVPKEGSPEAKALMDAVPEETREGDQEYLEYHIKLLGDPENCTVFHADSVEWPYPTLMRYHLFLQQEEYLKKFDYLFYLDLDMRVVNVVGDEILGDGLTAAEHPMYALRPNFYPPYEPNKDSASFIPRPGAVVNDNGKPRFKPLYFAGGFQGGRTEKFIEAMKDTKKLIDADLNRNYIPIWNDESAWNRYLFDNPPTTVLTPSYVYPDSMIDQYYKPVWGRDYPPKIVTLTKPFSTSSEGGQAAAQMMESMKGL